MIYTLSNHEYDFRNSKLYVDGKLAGSRSALYQTIVAELRRFGYKFNGYLRPAPVVLCNYKDCDYSVLFQFAANLFSILSSCGPEDKSILQACKITPQGYFETLQKERVYVVQVYDRYNHLLSFGSCTDLNAFSSLLDLGNYLKVF